MHLGNMNKETHIHSCFPFYDVKKQAYKIFLKSSTVFWLLQFLTLLPSVLLSHLFYLLHLISVILPTETVLLSDIAGS